MEETLNTKRLNKGLSHKVKHNPELRLTAFIETIESASVRIDGSNYNVT